VVDPCLVDPFLVVPFLEVVPFLVVRACLVAFLEEVHEFQDLRIEVDLLDLRIEVDLLVDLLVVLLVLLVVLLVALLVLLALLAFQEEVREKVRQAFQEVASLAFQVVLVERAFQVASLAYQAASFEVDHVAAFDIERVALKIEVDHDRASYSLPTDHLVLEQD